MGRREMEASAQMEQTPRRRPAERCFDWVEAGRPVRSASASSSSHHRPTTGSAAMEYAVKSGALVSLEELRRRPSSPFFADGSSLRVIGKLEEYSAEMAIAVIADGNARLKVNTSHLRDLSFRAGSMYQFIGELRYQQPENEAILLARVGRNVDGIDLKLYHQSVQLVRQFQAEQTSRQAAK